MEKYDRGSAIVIEVEFKQHTPFGTDAYFDPTDPKITITDPQSVAKVTDSALTKSSTGKWYYICQTTTSWDVGIYKSKVTATSGTYNDITITDNFQLK